MAYALRSRRRHAPPPRAAAAARCERQRLPASTPLARVVRHRDLLAVAPHCCLIVFTRFISKRASEWATKSLDGERVEAVGELERLVDRDFWHGVCLRLQKRGRLMPLLDIKVSTIDDHLYARKIWPSSDDFSARS